MISGGHLAKNLMFCLGVGAGEGRTVQSLYDPTQPTCTLYIKRVAVHEIPVQQDV